MFLAVFSFAIVAEAKEGDITPSSVIRLVNEARKEAKVEVLIENPKLKAAAEKKAQDMIDFDYFAHTSPQGKSPWDFIVAQGYDYRFAGENLAIDYASAKEQQKAWMDSPLHRKNILNPEYKEIGVATAVGKIDGRKTLVTVQEFGTRMVQMAPEVSSVDKLPSKSAVAGASINTAKTPVTLLESQFLIASKQLKFDEIFENNKLTMVGWVAAVILAFLMTVADILVLMYKRHKNSLEYLK